MTKNSLPASLMDRRKVLAGIGLLGVAGVVQARQPVPNRGPIPQKTFEGMIPDRVGSFAFETSSGLVLPPPDTLSNRLYDNLVTRVYASPEGEGMMCLLAYNNRQDGVLQIHRPEICYPAGGYTLSPIENVAIALPGAAPLPAQLFTATGDERNEVVMYWTRIGDSFPRKWAEQRLAVARENLRGIIPDGVMVRISVVGNDAEAARPKMEAFIGDFFRAASPRLRNLLFDTPISSR